MWKTEEIEKSESEIKSNIIKDDAYLKEQIRSQIQTCEEEMNNKEMKLNELDKEIDNKIKFQEENLRWYEDNNTKNKETKIKECQEELMRLKSPEEWEYIQAQKGLAQEDIPFYKKRIEELNKILKSLN